VILGYPKIIVRTRVGLQELCAVYEYVEYLQRNHYSSVVHNAFWLSILTACVYTFWKFSYTDPSRQRCRDQKIWGLQYFLKKYVYAQQVDFSKNVRV